MRFVYNLMKGAETRQGKRQFVEAKDGAASQDFVSPKFYDISYFLYVKRSASEMSEVKLILEGASKLEATWHKTMPTTFFIRLAFGCML
jgi:hypothetical protein